MLLTSTKKREISAFFPGGGAFDHKSIINGGAFNRQSCPKGGEFDHKSFKSSNARGVAWEGCLSFDLIDA